MEYSDIERLLELLKQFQKAWEEYEEKETQYYVWRDNYEDDEYYEGGLDNYGFELEEAADELFDSYLKVSKKICAQNISLVPNKEKETFKKIINILSDEFLTDAKGEKIVDLLKNIRFDSKDSPHVKKYVKLKLLLALPYFDPDEWVKEYIEIKPLVLRLDSRLPKEIEKRLHEATFCHIYGFYNASTAICRSVLEGLLKKKLQKEIPDVEKWELKEMLRWLEKKSVKEQQVAWNVKKVRKDANNILHNLHENMSKDKSKNILLDTRKLLEELI